MQEDGIEILIQLFQLLLLQLGRLGDLEQLVQVAVLHLAVHHLAVVVELVHILRAETHEPTYIFLLHLVGLGELPVEGGLLAVQFGEGFGLRGQLAVEPLQLTVRLLLGGTGPAQLFALAP